MFDQTYIVGTLALWAGDYKKAQELFSKTAEQSEYQLHEPKSALAFIAQAQESRSSQLQKQSDEFSKSRMGLPDSQREIQAGGYVLRNTNHLAGVITRKDVRDFEMRGYLTDLSWSKKLLRNAEELCSYQEWKSEEEKKSIIPTEQGISDILPDIEARQSHPTGFTWEYPGDLFLQVHVNCLGMILARGFWCAPQFPKFDRIEIPFRNILRMLDPEDNRQPIEQFRRLMQ